MSDKKVTQNVNLGWLGPMLILAYGPLNWTFPWWLWTLALVGPVIITLILTAFAGLAIFSKR
jgi:hypothetical protein